MNLRWIYLKQLFIDAATIFALLFLCGFSAYITLLIENSVTLKVYVFILLPFFGTLLVFYNMKVRIFDSFAPLSGFSIYALQEKDGDIFYVGQTTRNIKSREQEHKRKFPNKMFVTILLEENVNLMKLDEREVFWIKEMSRKYKLENKTSGGSALYKRIHQ